METQREIFKKYGQECLLTPEYIEDLRNSEKLMMEMANAMLKGPEAYSEWLFESNGAQSVLIIGNDEKIIASIFEELLEAEENFDKIN